MATTSTIWRRQTKQAGAPFSDWHVLTANPAFYLCGAKVIYGFFEQRRKRPTTAVCASCAAKLESTKSQKSARNRASGARARDARGRFVKIHDTVLRVSGYPASPNPPPAPTPSPRLDPKLTPVLQGIAKWFSGMIHKSTVASKVVFWVVIILAAENASIAALIYFGKVTYHLAVDVQRSGEPAGPSTTDQANASLSDFLREKPAPPPTADDILRPVVNTLPNELRLRAAGVFHEATSKIHDRHKIGSVAELNRFLDVNLNRSLGSDYEAFRPFMKAWTGEANQLANAGVFASIDDVAVFVQGTEELLRSGR
jgi:hypothetical protein